MRIFLVHQKNKITTYLVMANFKTLLQEASERYESVCRIMIRIACQTSKLLKSRDTLIHS